MRNVRFYSLAGKFAPVREQAFASAALALDAVKAHAASGGYVDVREVMDDDPCSSRYTARTPGGRAGRNIAFADFGQDSETGG